MESARTKALAHKIEEQFVPELEIRKQAIKRRQSVNSVTNTRLT